MSQPSISKVEDYLVWLWEDQGLSLSSVKAHLSMLSSVFQFKLPALGEDRVLQDLLRSFAIERPRRPQAPPSWDLDAVLRHLMSSVFEQLESVSLRALTKKTLFLVSLATAKRVCEIQALSKTVAAIGNDLVVSFLPHFIAKTERVDAPVAAFVFYRCESSQGTWRRAPSCVLCGLSTSTCGELVLLLLEPLLCLCLLVPPLVRSQRMRFRIF